MAGNGEREPLRLMHRSVQDREKGRETKMQRSLRYVAALAVLLLVGASVATVDAAPGRSITGLFVSQGNGNGGGNGNASEDETTEPAANSGNANANENAGQGAANADDGAANANANAGERADNANDGAGNADENATLAKTSAEGDDEGGKGGQSAAQNNQASPVPTDHKEMVCHLTGSESNPTQVIVIDVHAVPAHEAHGDFVIESEDECVAPAASPTVEPTEPPASPTAEPGTPTASPIASPTET
jgi:hypothetical protein